MGRLSICSLVLFYALFSPGCSDDDKKKECLLNTTTGCSDGKICEEVDGGSPACFLPVIISGQVINIRTSEGIEGATVIAVDSNGSARSSVVITEPDGSYLLTVPTKRSADGALITEQVILQVAASGFQQFPSPPRTAVPIDLGDYTEEISGLIITNPATTVGLLEADSGSGRGIVKGHVVYPTPGGVLVVAEKDGVGISTAITDSQGEFILFNLPEGDLVIAGYRAGINVESDSVTLGASAIEGVELVASDNFLGHITGSVNIVNAPGGSKTSVLLVPESIFNETTLSGQAPFGLIVREIDGAFEIDGVPPGTYVVLAAFENDGLVRDPDESIGGTELVLVTVPDTGGDINLEQSFKVTEALATFSPGADGMEQVSVPPELVWADDSSEDGYWLKVYDAFGVLIYEDSEVPRVTGSERVFYELDEVSLESGMIYQFRVLSFKEHRGEITYISSTEDLRGVFQFNP